MDDSRGQRWALRSLRFAFAERPEGVDGPALETEAQVTSSTAQNTVVTWTLPQKVDEEAGK